MRVNRVEPSKSADLADRSVLSDAAAEDDKLKFRHSRGKRSPAAVCRGVVRRLIAPLWTWCSTHEGSGHAAIAGLCSAEQFWKTLHRERARTERSGMPFSLLTFTPRQQSSAHATLSCLARILTMRLRLTDEAGWLDQWQVGVVLPATGAAGAWKVADDVVRAFSDDVLPPLCKVYGYPCSGQLGEEAFPMSGRDVAGEVRPADSLEPLLAQPLPPWKRAIDVVGALSGLILLLPLLAIVALLVRGTSPGPVLFRQWRAGLAGRHFLILKFRTMTADAEQRKQSLLAHNQQDGPAFKMAGDPRVTALGRILRSTSIDELPQLWNVLKGDMSLVGPRPLPVDEQSRCLPWHARRLDVTPGLTCIWQVRGRSMVTFDEWMRMDMEYVKNASPLLDLKLLLATIRSVLSRRGTH
jgi:lipopolysaccharide/colanic/teichoic acid biosynthesis glycosyltransferase